MDTSLSSYRLIGQDDDEPKISTKMADYFAALYAEEEDNKTTRESPPQDVDSCGKCGSTTETGMGLGVECSCAKMPIADNSRHSLGPLLAPPSLLRLVHLSSAESSAEPPTAAVHQCANPNCRSVTSAGLWHNSRLLSAKVCHACAQHERKYHKLRLLSKPCANVNCGKTINKDKEQYNSALIPGGKLCRACSAYEGKHGQARPLSLTKRCANVSCGENIAKSTQRYSSVLILGGMLCSPCGTYERRRGEPRPLSLINRATRRVKRL
ncbi:hypothetical protein C8F04DRAFT_346496 [Mycena alexandri]|uniref:GATA-type domain-containing protein n=1 Tax=Mycena alexandri TaxID=1745969 RepID=A0AAD6XFQ3_9AGAR|nr:hypothetical protein C8F04DRAFT_346496 [Mycena alexandri]